jgi:hypothetical protein
MRKVILILLVFISAKVNAQVYQEMPQYGYRANRMAFDSTLQIPTTCGVPTLRSNVTKKSAIAFDSCNNKLYRYNPSNFTWAEVSGGTGLTYNLQRVLDSGAIAYNRNLTLIDSGNGYANRTTIAFDLQRFGADNYMTINDVNNYRVAKYSNQYARISSLSSGGGNGKSIQIGWENTSDNFMSLSFAKSDFTYAHKLKSGSTFANAYTTTIPAVTGTLAMSVNNQTADANGNITITSTLDTTNQFVKRLTRTEGKDSIIYFVGANRFAIKDSVGNTSGFVPYTGATSNVDLGTKNITANTYFNGFTSMFAKNDTIILSIDSTPVHLVKGSGGQAYKLPVATTLPNGTIFSFNNNQSSGAINILSNSIANTLVKSVPSGAYLTLELTDNTTATGSWDAHFQTPSNVSWSSNTLDYNGSITSAQWNGTTVAYNRGGTGQSSTFTQGGIVYGSSTSAMATSSAGTSGQMLISNGTSAPTWADTSALQRKSISAYTILANKTSATANVTAQAFRDTSGVYDGTITWTGTTAPSGATNHTYRLTQVGKCVTINISLLYATNGLAISKLVATLPSNAPTPVQPTGLTSALQNIYVANGQYITSTNTTANTILRATLRNNTSNNGFEFLIEGVSNTVAQVNIICQYWTN